MNGDERRNKKFARAYLAARKMIDDSVGEDPKKRILLSNLTKEELEEYKLSLRTQKRAINREFRIRVRQERREENREAREENIANAKKAGFILLVTIVAIGAFVLVKKGIEIQQAKVDYAITHADEIIAEYNSEQNEHEDKPGRDLLDVGQEAAEDVVEFFKGLGGK